MIPFRGHHEYTMDLGRRSRQTRTSTTHPLRNRSMLRIRTTPLNRGRSNRRLRDRPLRESRTETLRLRQAIRHSPQTVILITLAGSRASATCHLDNESSTLDAVDKDVARFEVCVAAPGAEELDLSATGKRIVFRVNVEESGFADGFACWVARNGGDVEDADTGAVA